MANTIETAATTVWLEDGIIRIRSKGVISTRETVGETFAAVRTLTADGPKPVLFDATQWPNPDWGAWPEMIDGMPTVFTAAAVLMATEPEADVGVFPDYIARLLMPFGVFTDEGEALVFLNGHLSNE